MKQYIDTVTDELSDLPVPGAEVFVYNDDATENTGASLATLYASDGETEISNPLTTNSQGEYSFYQNTSEFTAVVYYGGRLRRRLRLLVGGGYSGASQTAAAAALAAAGVGEYASTAAGLADTVVNETFWVDQGDGTGQVYRHDAGPVATALNSFILDPTATGAASIFAGGVVRTAILGGTGGGGQVGLSDGTVADAIKYITPQMKGGTGTAAIQGAIDSNNAELQLPPASYSHGDLNFDNQYQRVLGWGSVLTRSGSGVTTTLGARGVQCFAARFSGAGASGENITVTKPDVSLILADSRDTTGTPLLAENDASNMLVFGGVYSVIDPGGTEWEIILRDAVPGTSLYANIIAIATNQGSGNEGGILGDGAGTIRIALSQFGKLRMQNGSGALVIGNRVNGDTAILSPASQFSCNSFAGDVSFGDGSAPNIGQICFGPSNAVQTGQTLTVGSEVIESTFHLGHIEAGGSTVVVNNYNNNIWHDSRAYTPTIAADGGGFVMGASTIEGWHSHDGRKAELFIRFTVGAGFNFGTGPIYFTTPVDNGYAVPAPMNCKHGAIGSVYMLDDGTTHKIGVARMSTTDSAKRGRIYIFSEGSNAPVSGTVPFTWAAGDRIELSIRFEWDSE